MGSKRKAYKPLYLAAVERCKDVNIRLAITQRRLREIEEALAPYGRTMLESAYKCTAPLRYAPLEYVAARAFIDSNARIMADEAPSEGTLYTWRGRPILKKEE